VRGQAIVLLGLIAAAPPPEPGRAGLYRLQPGRTRMVFSTVNLGIVTFRGVFTGASGEMSFDPADSAHDRIDVAVPIAGLASDDAAMAQELKGPGWFDAARFPTMVFRSTAVWPTGPQTADVDGLLTLHGVTAPVTFTARFAAAGVDPVDHAYTAGFEVQGRIRRSLFGLKRLIPEAGDEVRLEIVAGFEKPAS
jgi:polyisoprenoid-binding protein YceI